LGNGTKIKFWKDYWLHRPLKEVYPELYQQIENKEDSVPDHFIQGQWQIHTHVVLTGQANRQLIQLQENLQELTPSQEDDTVIWLRHLTGNFSSKSAYQFIAKPPAISTSIQNIWTIKAPPRVQIFL
jgi:hypothetical protein